MPIGPGRRARSRGAGCASTARARAGVAAGRALLGQLTCARSICGRAAGAARAAGAPAQQLEGGQVQGRRRVALYLQVQPAQHARGGVHAAEAAPGVRVQRQPLHALPAGRQRAGQVELRAAPHPPCQGKEGAAGVSRSKEDLLLSSPHLGPRPSGRTISGLATRHALLGRADGRRHRYVMHDAVSLTPPACCARSHGRIRCIRTRAKRRTLTQVGHAPRGRGGKGRRGGGTCWPACACGGVLQATSQAPSHAPSAAPGGASLPLHAQGVRSGAGCSVRPRRRAHAAAPDGRTLSQAFAPPPGSTCSPSQPPSQQSRTRSAAHTAPAPALALDAPATLTRVSTKAPPRAAGGCGSQAARAAVGARSTQARARSAAVAPGGSSALQVKLASAGRPATQAHTRASSAASCARARRPGVRAAGSPGRGVSARGPERHATVLARADGEQQAISWPEPHTCLEDGALTDPDPVVSAAR